MKQVLGRYPWMQGRLGTGCICVLCTSVQITLPGRDEDIDVGWSVLQNVGSIVFVQVGETYEEMLDYEES